MKFFALFTAIALTITFISSAAFAKHPEKNSAKQIDWRSVEKNYLHALSSDNIGIRNSAIAYIARYRLTGASESLITVLRSDKVEQLRMSAASALMQLGNEAGVQAVREATVYDGSEKVSRYCEQLINGNASTVSLQ